MSNFGTLLRYELKKIVCRKLFVITAVLLILITSQAPFSNVIGSRYENGTAVESYFSYYMREQSGKRALSGRTINLELMEETLVAYDKVPNVQRYSETPEYRENALAYNEIYSFIRQSLGISNEDMRTWVPDEEELYRRKAEKHEEDLKENFTTDSEKEFWKNQYEKIEKPYKYYYHDAYSRLNDGFMTVCVLTLAFLAIVLSGIFPGEKAMKTDGLILSCAHGKKPTYVAKMLAGITVSVGTVFAVGLLSFAVCLGFYGTEGFNLPLDFDIGFSMYPLTVGQASLMLYGMFFISAALWAVFIMFVSEFIKNGMATLSASMLLLIATNMVSFPVSARVLGQIWDWLPVNYPSVWNMFDERTLPIFGKCFTSWQVLPIIYFCLIILLFFFGKRKYERLSRE